jgi:hypothetical protein
MTSPLSHSPEVSWIQVDSSGIGGGGVQPVGDSSATAMPQAIQASPRHAPIRILARPFAIAAPLLIAETMI